MKNPSWNAIASVILLLSVSVVPATLNVSISINTALDRHQISPYIYGTNQKLTGTENFSAFRQGGNRLTGYNWENNASHAGTDWNNSNDNFMTYTMGIPDNQANIPGIVVTAFIDSCIKAGAYPLITLQMAGYVAHDKNGTVAANETAPSIRWRSVLPKKSSAFAAIPDTADTAVYMDEFVNFLSQKYAPISFPWFGGCDLDNEPALWPSTHPRIHPAKPLCEELVDKSIALASAVKAVEPRHEIFGPVAFGFSELYDFNTATDWASVKGGSAWFVDWYLDKMSQASQSAGKRLLDVFDFHWYSEATGNSIRITDTTQSKNPLVAQARIQAPRTLWDKNYVENSWIGQWFSSFLPLLPQLKQSIAAHYPGTKLSISEYNYGGEDHISGGIAMSDVLGIYGKYGVDYASYWKMYPTAAFTSAAFKIFRNYDGSNSTFGTVSIRASTNDSLHSSAYASVVSAYDNELHIVVINKQYDTTLNASVTINSPIVYNSIRAWGFDSSSSTITEKLPQPAIVNNTFSISLPRLSVYHIVASGPASTIQMMQNHFKNISLRYSSSVKPAIYYDLNSQSPMQLDLYSLDGKLLQRFENLTGKGILNFAKSSTKCVIGILRLSNGNAFRTLVFHE